MPKHAMTPTKAHRLFAISAVLMGSALAGPTAFAQAPAQAPPQAPHVHGAGALAIAIEGTTVQMELEAPGADIVGFEHAARTAAQRKALATAKAALSKPLSLFEIPATAGCKVTSAKVDFTGGEAKGGHGHDHAHDHRGKPAKGKAEAPADDHAEFRATYLLDCPGVARLDAIAFPYFKRFKAAEKLAVTLIAPKGQSQFDVTRDKPRLDLSGLM